MKRVSMIARKALTYGTRRLRAGDAFEASRQDARVLTAVGLASDARANVYAPLAATPKRPPPPQNTASSKGDAPTREPDPEVEALREAYKVQTGRRPHYLWTAERIREAIASLNEAQGI
jgi:hypothetical protein